MRRDVAGILLFGFMLCCCVQAQQASATECDPNLGSVPGGEKEYNLFKNLASTARGCTSPSAVTYEKIESPKAAGRSAPSQTRLPQSASPQQEELDRTACRSEGEEAAKAAHGLRPGEYDLFKNILATRSGDADRVEQSCMAQRGYRNVAN